MTSLSTPQSVPPTPVAMGRPALTRPQRKYQLHLAITRATNDRQIKRGTGDFLHWLLRQAQIVDHGVRVVRAELAQKYGKSLSSIKNYLVEGARAAFVQVTRRGAVVFPFLDDERPEMTTYDDLVAEAWELAMADKYLEAGLALKRAYALRPEGPQPSQASFFVPSEQTINCPPTDNFVPDPSFNTDHTDRAGEARPPTPQPGGRRRRHVFFGREEFIETEGTVALREVGVCDAGTLARLASVAASTVREVVTALRARLGPDGFGPGLIVHALENGLWRVQGQRPPAVPDREDVSRFVTDDYCPDCGRYTFGNCEHAGQPPGGA